MFYVAFSILLVALALNAESAFGTNQHLICKIIGDVFSDGTLSQASIRPHTIQGPPGKRGQTGVKGQPGIPGSKGERGVSGSVDPQDIGNVVEEKMRAVTREFRERLETLEGKVLELNATKQVDLLPCNEAEGTIYKLKCYNLILHTTRDITYAKAIELCNAKGGRPADILNAEHQSLVADYLRRKTSSHVEIWLGMSYMTGTLRFSNGIDVTGDVAESIRWWSGYPISTSSWDAMRIVVSTTTYGFANVYPTFSVHGVLCEK